MITQEQADAYAAFIAEHPEGNVCPRCESVNRLDAGNYDGHRVLTFDVTCSSCKLRWTEMFTFYRVTEVHGPGDERIEPTFDPWGEDPAYPRADWRYEVAENNTNQGYWEWARHQKGCDREDEPE